MRIVAYGWYVLIIDTVRIVAAGNVPIFELALTAGVIAALSVSYLLILVGSLQMLAVRRLRLSRVAAALATIPCLSPLVVVGIPFGIWALAVLSTY